MTVSEFAVAYERCTVRKGPPGCLLSSGSGNLILLGDQSDAMAADVSNDVPTLGGQDSGSGPFIQDRVIL